MKTLIIRPGTTGARYHVKVTKEEAEKYALIRKRSLEITEMDALRMALHQNDAEINLSN